MTSPTSQTVGAVSSIITYLLVPAGVGVRAGRLVCSRGGEASGSWSLSVLSPSFIIPYSFAVDDAIALFEHPAIVKCLIISAIRHAPLPNTFFGMPCYQGFQDDFLASCGR